MYEYKAIVTHIVDGDTIDADVDLGFHLTAKLRLRFSRINTPERGKPGFTEATDRVKELIPVGALIHITTSKTGGFGRWLAEINYFNDQAPILPINLNNQLLREGYAVPYVRK